MDYQDIIKQLQAYTVVETQHIQNDAKDRAFTAPKVLTNDIIQIDTSKYKNSRLTKRVIGHVKQN